MWRFSQCVLLLFVCTMVSGCYLVDKLGRPRATKGDIKQQTQEQISDSLNVKMKAVYDQPKDPELADRPLTFTFNKEAYTFPSGTKVSFETEAYHYNLWSDIYSLVGSIDYRSQKLGIAFIGILFIAGGCVLIYLGFRTLGLVAILFGVVILSALTLYEKYPIVLLGVAIIIILGAGIGIYYTVKTKKLSTVVDETKLTLAEVVDAVEHLKTSQPEIAKQYITDKLAKSDDSATIKKVVTEVKNG